MDASFEQGAGFLVATVPGNVGLGDDSVKAPLVAYGQPFDPKLRHELLGSFDRAFRPNAYRVASHDRPHGLVRVGGFGKVPHGEVAIRDQSDESAGVDHEKGSNTPVSHTSRSFGNGRARRNRLRARLHDMENQHQCIPSRARHMPAA